MLQQRRAIVVAVGLVAGLCLLVPISASYYVAFYSAKIFESSASLIMTPGRGAQVMSGSYEEKLQNEQVNYDQVVKSQINIILTDDVIRAAVEEVGPETLYTDLKSKLHKLADHAATEATRSSGTDFATDLARANLTVSSELNTFVVRLRFRNANPLVASGFLNVLMKKFLAKRAELYNKSGAESFFQKQVKDYEGKLKSANERLKTFSASSGLFDVGEQRTLMLSRASDAAKSLSITQEDIKKTESEIESYRLSISSLKLRLNLPPEIYGNLAEGKGLNKGDNFSGDPPLLNVKLYQQIADKLVEANAKISGLRSLEAEQKQLLKSINLSLGTLQTSEAEYTDIKSEISRYEDYINTLSKKAIDSRINGLWSANENSSAAQVLQSASIPSLPVFPRPALLMLLGSVTGIVLSSLVVYFGLFWRRRDKLTFDEKTGNSRENSRVSIVSSH